MAEPERWRDFKHAFEDACLSVGSSIGETKMALIKAFADGTIRTRWHGHYSGGNPHIDRQRWTDADVDLTRGRVVLADGSGMQGVEVNDGDLQTWLIGTTTKKRKKKTPVQQERAKKALKALFGDRLPAPSDVSNPELNKRVNDWLTSNEIGGVSLDSVVRAAGRRSK